MLRALDSASKTSPQGNTFLEGPRNASSLRRKRCPPLTPTLLLLPLHKFTVAALRNDAGRKETQCGCWVCFVCLVCLVWRGHRRKQLPLCCSARLLWARHCSTQQALRMLRSRRAGQCSAVVRSTRRSRTSPWQAHTSSCFHSRTAEVTSWRS